MGGLEKENRELSPFDSETETVVPDAVVSERRKLLNPEEIASYFLPGGNVEKTFGDGYEFRKQQQSVTREITLAFNGDSIALVEAPTGTGKTLSYLIPSARWALLNGERVVISTNTINLQDQIINKDIPMLGGILGKDIKYALVKGMRNYLCILRSEAVKAEIDQRLLPEANGADGTAPVEEREVIKWANKTSCGSVSDLGFTPSEDVWDKFAAESESCIKKECPHYKNCFFFKDRRKIAEAELIVVNHHLLFSDISIKHSAGRNDAGILPPNRRVVIDEAHNVVDSATSYFSLRISGAAVLKTLNRLKKAVSLSERVARKIGKQNPEMKQSVLYKALSGMGKVFLPRIKQTGKASETFFSSFLHAGTEFMREGDRAANLRVTANDMEKGGKWSKSAVLCSDMRTCSVSLSAAVKDAFAILCDLESGDETAVVIAELKAALKGLERLEETARLFADPESFTDFVKSVEVRKSGKNFPTSVSVSPIDISPHLRKFYSGYGTVILTSATLTAEGGFDFQRRSLGLERNERLTELAVPSPFEYKKQVLLALPSDIPEPSAGQTHMDNISQAVFECVKASRGGALVLFTSYQALRRASAEAVPRLAALGIKTLVQGQASREKLLDDFKSDGNSVLFATDSFREGVDIAGDSLRLVVITRLPFKVPDEPVFQARMEAIEAQGGNSFGDYAVPMAVVGFRQAFGRLIRTATDRGAVVVLDSRIVRRPYGKRFVSSVPDCRMAVAPLKEIVRKTADCFSVFS